MKPRPDLVDDHSPQGLEVYQLTEGPLATSHLYMEAQVFTPDGKRMVVHKASMHHGFERENPEHAYLLCDLENGGELSPLTHEFRVTSASLSPDGEYCYYFHDETVLNGGRFALKRVRLDGTERETLMTLDGPLPGTSYRPSRLYSLSTVSSDGRRVALSAFLGDGERPNSPWGVLVFDLDADEIRLVIEGPTFLNAHAQYCRSRDAEASHDIMVQENHGGEFDLEGAVTRLVSGKGADIHLIRDDGTNLRTFPWGRDGRESCQGHQCWWGRSTAAITSTEVADTKACELVAGRPAPFSGHVGVHSPGGWRSTLSREFPQKPRFWHFQTDAEGQRLVTDYSLDGTRYDLYLARFGDTEDDPLQDWRYLLDTRTARTSRSTHPHPFFSPDGNKVFFNSDESGVLHAYMAVNLDG